MTERNDLSTEEARHRTDDEPVAGGHWPEDRADKPTTDATRDEESLETGTGTHWGQHTTDQHPTDEHATDAAHEERTVAATGTHWGQHTTDEHTTDEHSTDASSEEEPVGASQLSEETADEHVAEARAEDEPGEAALAREDAIGAESAVAADAAADADAAAQPDAAVGTEAAATSPTNAGDFAVEHLIDPADADRFHDSWHDIKAGFVDDPAEALRRASALSDDVVAELTTALARFRRNIDEHWQGHKNDTERLRVALRGHGSLIDRILER